MANQQQQLFRKEIEVSSVSSGEYEKGWIKFVSVHDSGVDSGAGNGWRVQECGAPEANESELDKAGNIIAVSKLKPNITIRAHSMTRKNPSVQQFRRGWQDWHFHSELSCPTIKSPDRSAMVVMLQARANECVAVALSPQAQFVWGKTIVVHFGGSGNINTVIRRRLPRHLSQQTVEMVSPSRVCSMDEWVTYWIIITLENQKQEDKEKQNSSTASENQEEQQTPINKKPAIKVYAGIGDIPGQQCITIMDDISYFDLDDEDVKDVEMDDSNNGSDEMNEKNVAAQENKDPPKAQDISFPFSHVGLSNSAVGQNVQPLLIRNVLVFSPDLSLLPPSLQSLRVDSLPLVTLSSGDEDDVVLPMLQRYKEECNKALIRSRKFGIPYQAPAPNVFFPSSHVHQVTHAASQKQSGFITGMDLTLSAEQEKIKARAQRFGIVTNQGDADQENEENGDEDKGDQAHEKRPRKEPLPTSQAWDNEGKVRRFRHDPPEKLWSQQSDNDKEQRQDDNVGDGDDDDCAWVFEKIHLCSIDFKSFQNMKTPNVLAYFSEFGPTGYVEWLNELSCNVAFQDSFSAARALRHLSQPIPPPPRQENDETVEAETTTTTMQEDGTVGAPEKAGVSMEADSEINMIKAETEAITITDPSLKNPKPPLGQMGWLFCKHPILQQRRRPARILMRLATTWDTCERMGSDKKKTKSKKRQNSHKQRSRPNQKNNANQNRRRRRYSWNDDEDNRGASRGRGGGPRKRRRLSHQQRREETTGDFVGEHPLLSQSLGGGGGGKSSQRPGYTVEEMQQERAAAGSGN